MDPNNGRDLINGGLALDRMRRGHLPHQGEDDAIDRLFLPEQPRFVLPPDVTLPRIPPPNPQDTQIPTAVDPNDIIGPSGYSTANFIKGDSVLPYRVDFENDARATAPAQVVTITNQLPSTLDWSTFRLTEVGFGDKILSIPANAQHYQTAVPMTYNGKTFNVLVEAGIHGATGEVYATFQSLDAVTQLPPDVLTGFLPQEDGTGRGQGHISYTVQAKTNVTTGTEIRNVALITFDQNGAIATDQVDEHDPSKGHDPNKQALVTIDRGAPASQVQGLAATQGTMEFTVQWAGQDDATGSGIASYDVYVSDNGGPFTLFLDHTTKTSEVFTGMNGHTYGFFSVARDNVGLTQPLSTAAHATTRLEVVPPALASVFSRNVHGSIGAFDLPLSLDESATVEPRLNGPNTLVFNFTQNIAIVSGTPGASNFTITNGTFAGATISGSTLTLNLSGVVDQSMVTVGLNGITGAAGGALTGVSTVSVRSLYGDVNQTGSVGVSDLQGVKNHLLQPLDGSNYLFDVNQSGSISVSDMQVVKNNLLHGVSAAEPARPTTVLAKPLPQVIRRHRPFPSNCLLVCRTVASLRNGGLRQQDGAPPQFCRRLADREGASV